MYYIAYGSNMNKEQMSYRCPNSKPVGIGYIKGWKLYFNYHADIINTNNPNDETLVVIWDIAPEDWKFLDKYEGFPNYYKKVEIETYFMDTENPDGEPLDVQNCIAYVMTEENANGFDFPAFDYYRTIARGYKDFGLNLNCLVEAITTTAECAARL